MRHESHAYLDFVVPSRMTERNQLLKLIAETLISRRWNMAKLVKRREPKHPNAQSSRNAAGWLLYFVRTRLTVLHRHSNLSGCPFGQIALWQYYNLLISMSSLFFAPWKNYAFRLQSGQAHH